MSSLACSIYSGTIPRPRSLFIKIASFYKNASRSAVTKFREGNGNRAVSPVCLQRIVTLTINPLSENCIKNGIVNVIYDVKLSPPLSYKPLSCVSSGIRFYYFSLV